MRIAETNNLMYVYCINLMYVYCTIFNGCLGLVHFLPVCECECVCVCVCVCVMRMLLHFKHFVSLNLSDFTFTRYFC